MQEILLESIISSFVSEVTTKAEKIFGRATDEIKQFLSIGLKNYLNKQKDKYSYIKTLLNGNTPTYLYNIYYPLKLTFEPQDYQRYTTEDDSTPSISTNSSTELFSKYPYLTIIGDAGSGKSTLIKHLFLNSIEERTGIPILIELRYLNKYDNSLHQYIIDKVFENKISENSTILNRLLEKGHFVFFLDGYDELNSDSRQQIVESINSYVNTYNKNKFILTTRPYSDIEHLPLFKNLFVRRLNEIEIEGFIKKQLETEHELSIKIIASIKTNPNEYIRTFLTNPLLLSLFILTFQSDASIPNKKFVFYRRVINALFAEHDSKTKLGFIRERLCKLNQEQFEEVLRTFCFLSFFDSKYDWDFDYATNLLSKIKQRATVKDFDNISFIKDLKQSTALWIEDNGTLSFAHRSLQEYFAALFIKNLNPDANRKMYDKIILRFSRVTRFHEVKNFLSLLEEMDELNFKRHYYLPLLLELRERIDEHIDDNYKTLSFVRLLSRSINIPTSNDFSNFFYRIIEINDETLYKAIYIHLPYVQKLYDSLSDMITQDAFKECNLSNNKNVRVKKNELRSNKNQYEYIAIDTLGDIPKDVLDILHLNLGKLTAEFLDFINREIQITRQFIEDSVKFDDDLINMI